MKSAGSGVGTFGSGRFFLFFPGKLVLLWGKIGGWVGGCDFLVTKIVEWFNEMLENGLCFFFVGE